MTNLTTAFSNWSAPAIAGIFAMTAATSGVSAETSTVNIKTPSIERVNRSTSSASTNQAQTQLRVRGGVMETRMQDGKMVLTGMAGAFGGGKVQLSGKMPADVESDKSLNLRFADVSTQKAAEVLGKPDVAAWLGNATLSGTVKGEWEGKGLSQISRSADGALTVVAGKGVISDKAVLQKLGKLAGISELEQLRFDSIKIKARAENGVVVIESATVEGPDLNLAMAGRYLVASDDLNLKIAMSVAPHLADRSTYLKVKNVLDIFKGGENEKAAGKFVEVPVLLVAGDLKKPEVSLDKSRPVKAVVASAGEGESQPVKSATPGFLARVKQLAKTE